MDNKAEVSTNSQISINSPNKKNIKSWQQIVFFLFIVIISTFVPLPDFVKREVLVVLVVWLGVIVLWIMETLHLAISGFLGCLLLYSLGATNGWSTLKNSAFSGFSEPTVWFVFGGLIIGLATHKSGIGKSIAYLLFNRVGGNFQRILFGYILTLLAVTYMVPSSDAVTVIMCTLAVGLVETPEFAGKKNIAKIMFLVPAIAAGVLNKAILHGTSAIVAAGIIEKFSGQPVSFSSWFIYMLPAQVLFFLWLFCYMRILFKPEEFSWPKHKTKIDGVSKFNPIQKRTAFWLGLGMILWFTDKLTNIRPDIVCMSVAVGLLMPAVGSLSIKELKEELNWLILIFLGTAFSLVNTLEQVGIFQGVCDGILKHIPDNMPLSLMVIAIAVLALVIHFLTGHTSMVVASVLPVILKWGALHNIPVQALGFAFLWGASGEFLIFQSGAFMIAYAYGHFSVTDLMKAGIFSILGIMLIILFLDLLWWPLLGF